jgi:hypothetical protein
MNKKELEVSYIKMQIAELVAQMIISGMITKTQYFERYHELCNEIIGVNSER